MLKPYFYNIGWKYSKMCSLVLTSLNALHYISFCLRLLTQSPVDVYEAVCPHTKRLLLMKREKEDLLWSRNTCSCTCKLLGPGWQVVRGLCMACDSHTAGPHPQRLFSLPLLSYAPSQKPDAGKRGLLQFSNCRPSRVIVLPLAIKG